MSSITDNGFIIHSKPFGETSVIFDFFTEENGLISTILKGAKKRKDISQLQPSREFIINTSRGGLVDEVACRAALETGHLSGAAFDVFTEEPANENILFDAPNFVATPHLGAATIEAQENVAIQIAQQMSDFLNTGAVVNAINYPSVSAEEAPILKPYVQLAYLMGSFLGQVTQEGILSVKLELEGKASNLLDVPLMASSLVGILEPSSAAVNNISSASIASSSANSAARLCDTGSSEAAVSGVIASADGAASSPVLADLTSARVVSSDGVPAAGFFRPSCKARTRAARSCAVRRSSKDGTAGAGAVADVAVEAAADPSTVTDFWVRDGAAGARLRRTSTCTVLRPAPTAGPARSLLGSIAPSVSLPLDRLSFFVLPLSSLILNLSWHQRATPRASMAADCTAPSR